MKYHLLVSKDGSSLTEGSEIPDGYNAVYSVDIPYDKKDFINRSILEELKLEVRIAKYNHKVDPSNKYYASCLDKAKSNLENFIKENF